MDSKKISRTTVKRHRICRLSPSQSAADAMTASFYKMFGYPTGVGALIAKKSFLRKLQRPWFAGGNFEHDAIGAPVVRILSALPARRLKSVGAQFDVGSIVSLIFLSGRSGPTGEMIPNSFMEHAASRLRISLWTAAILGIERDMEQFYTGVTLADLERAMRCELGVVRISLGLASNFADVWKVVGFARLVAVEKTRMALWNRWEAEMRRTH
ncbi:hypothetical protein C8R44DRAFT_883582 [Mycena epipterygia]|nr:hypothetical protein C8R44DRAFT_883582 [Mycena epipterygia]